MVVRFNVGVRAWVVKKIIWLHEKFEKFLATLPKDDDDDDESPILKNELEMAEIGLGSTSTKSLSQDNLQVSSSDLRDQAVKKVNEALEGQDPDVLVECLQEPILDLTEFIHQYAATLYLKGNNCYNAKTILTVLPTLQCPISKQSFQF